MLDLATERQHLAKAEKDVGEGGARVLRQIQLIQEMHERGENSGEAERLLTTFQQTLEAWKEHREQILQAIDRIEQKGR